jgi:hypothetical protein
MLLVRSTLARIGSLVPTQLCAALIAGVGLAACGGSETPHPQTAESVDTDDAPSESRGGMAASAEVGALDPGEVTKTFEKAMSELQSCLRSGAKRVEPLGGEIAFYLEVDVDGRAQHVHAERSTLGDRETERCMLDALKSREWPKPQGGQKGLARNSFDFDMPNDVRPPVAWDGSQVSDAISEVRDKLADCGSARGLVATVYVDTEGKAMAAGVSGEDPSAEAAADCVSGVLREAKYPSPGSWPAKVTFSL